MPDNPLKFLSSKSLHISDSRVYNYKQRFFSIAQQIREQEAQQQHETFEDNAEFLRTPKSQFNQKNNSDSQQVKKQKMMHRSSLEWEYLANIIDRILLFLFCLITVAFFLVLVFFDVFFKIDY